MTSQTPFCNVDSGGEGTQSYFGVMHMGGNVVEWTEDQHSTMAPPSIATFAVVTGPTATGISGM